MSLELHDPVIGSLLVLPLYLKWATSKPLYTQEHPTRPADLNKLWPCHLNLSIWLSTQIFTHAYFSYFRYINFKTWLFDWYLIYHTSCATVTRINNIYCMYPPCNYGMQCSLSSLCFFLFFSQHTTNLTCSIWFWPTHSSAQLLLPFLP